MRDAIHVPWHVDRVKLDIESFADTDRAVWLASKFIFDFGSGNALRPTGMILFVIVEGLDTSLRTCFDEYEAVDINTLELTVEGVSDWSMQAFTLV